MSGRCAVLRNKKEREKEERLAEKDGREQIGEKRDEARRERESKPLGFSIFKERGTFIFPLSRERTQSAKRAGMSLFCKREKNRLFCLRESSIKIR